jgi:RimJ/RimL family protein N-acetyltransferase
VTELRTERLLLRRWKDSDREPFAALNADPEVRKFFPGILTREESDALVERIEAGFQVNGFGWWAAEIVETGEFIGFIGLSPLGPELPCGPGIEIGWRLARRFWGCGYATEGARACLAHAFGPLGAAEVVAFTAVGNTRSRAVMDRLGMTHDPAEDFDHPAVPVGHPIARHALYRITGSSHVE